MQAFFHKDVKFLKPATWAILLLATILRCYHLSEIPLTNDELSALDRLRFASFSGLLQHGILPDGHPALVQVFLYYYTQLVGISPVAVKLPFILCGIAGVYVASRVFGRLFNEKTGLFVAAFMATSQFFVMHGQMARPYAPGLLFVLLLTGQLLRVSERRAGKSAYVLIAVWLVLLASTHYLAALTGIVLCVLFWLYARHSRKALGIAYGVAALLYVPQLPVFWQHLQVGGVGTWLGKPTPVFSIDFLQYLSQFRLLVLFAFLVGAALSVLLVLSRKISADQSKRLGIAFAVFAITYLFLFYYSVFRNPVLQYPSLLFATPFLLAFACYPVTFLPGRRYVVVLLVFTALQVYSLTVSRKHYDVFYNQGYQAVAETVSNRVHAGTPLLLNGNGRYYFDYYFERTAFKPAIVHDRIGQLSYTAFDSLLRSVKQDTIVVAHAFDLPLAYFSLARSLFPDSVYCEQHAFNETWVLARKKSWTVHGPYTHFNASREFGIPVTFILAGPLQFRLEAYSHIIQPEKGPVADPELALSVKNTKGEQVYWHADFYRRFNTGNTLGGKVFVTSDIVIPAQDTFRFVVVVINGKREHFTASQPKIRIGKSNTLLLGTVQPLN